MVDFPGFILKTLKVNKAAKIIGIFPCLFSFFKFLVKFVRSYKPYILYNHTNHTITRTLILQSKRNTIVFVTLLMVLAKRSELNALSRTFKQEKVFD